MSTTDGPPDIDPQILDELARVGRYLEADEDLGDALARLFELRGALLAMPLPPAAMLAEEIQRGCEMLGYGRCTDREETREVLSLALSQLANYLQRVGAGEPPRPVTLLAAINDLRHCRGAAPSSAAELSSMPALLAQSPDPSPQSLEALGRMAETVRPHFHRYLVRWLNNGTPEAGLSGLARLFGHARRRFGQGAANDLFLAAEGVIEGLIDGSIVADAATKALVLRLDRILRSLTAVPPEWPRGLVMAMSRDLVDVLAQKSPASPALGELAHMHVRRLSEGGVPDDGAEPKSASRQDPRRATGALQAASGPEGDAAASGARRRAPLQGPAAVALRDARAALRGVGAELGGTERTQTSSGSLAALAETVRGIANALTRIGASEPAALLDGLSAELRQRVDGPGASSGEVDRALMQRAIAAIEIDLEERLERVEGDPRMRALAGDALKRLSHPLPRGDGLIGDSRVADPLPLFEASQAIDIESLGLVLDQAGGHPGTPLSESHRDTGEIAEARDGEPSAADLHPTADWLDQMIDGSAELDAIQIGLAQQNTRLALRLEQFADELKPLGSGAESLASLTGLRLETADLLHRHRDLGEALRRILLRSTDSDGESLAANMAWSRRRPKVLIVSDAQPVQPLTGRSLRREHIDVATETDPVAARTTLLQRPPDLLLIDLRRAVDGVALARHVRSADTLRYLPIVMLMSDDDESHSDALTAGADRILSAPFDQEVLLAWIERLLAPDAGPVGAVR